MDSQALVALITSLCALFGTIVTSWFTYRGLQRRAPNELATQVSENSHRMQELRDRVDECEKHRAADVKQLTISENAREVLIKENTQLMHANYELMVEIRDLRKQV